ncbi:DUF6081 family protein [Hyalangium minutum]|uniref:Uncharacterized protein n=1 Tax=Hyalangium minutum TaxID=394096 RepID=A0A085WL01_9BACT|nr:DUF6081 family protein [Hyalangium minutum]KFE68364.1 hypothetical protein DB31_7601 [Hyalangium minutum]
MTTEKQAAQSAPSASPPQPSPLLLERFDSPFSVGTPGARWAFFSVGPVPFNDGLAQTSPDGLWLVPPGRNPRTGEPAYSLSQVPEKSADEVPGQFDHCKWLVFSTHKASTGLPGFDAVRGEELAFEAWMTGRTFGTKAHPFGPAVRNPEEDFRLATFGQNTIDVETGMVFDFLFTNEQIYALYERLPFARTPQNPYAAFTYAIPLARRTPEAVHHVKIAYDRAAGTVRWELEGKEVFRVDKLGRSLDSRWLIGDHGGQEQDVELRQLNVGFGLFSLLDCFLEGRGLVRLSGQPDFYVLPPAKPGQAAGFADEQSHASNRLFGQGAELRMRQCNVSSTPR